MFEQPQYLRIRRPSSTTVEYTVSTFPPRSSISGPVVFALTLLVRMFMGAALMAVNYAKWTLTYPHILMPMELSMLDSSVGTLAVHAAERLDWRLLLPLKESLLVLAGLGIQTSTTSATYLLTPTTRFIPTNLVQDIFIHEAFRGFEVRHYLAVVVQGEEEVVVVFPALLPRRKIVEEVWRGAKACLYEMKS
ncbi:MAG: hypothetical protein M1838_004061 [Thelocarpon superellum]|nr:MAG: hypothetical protein M1838_004061 [Thelocarpon superellum]